MSSFENPAPQPDSDPNIDIELPDEVDNAWCADFNVHYGHSGRRAVVNAYELLKRSRPVHGWGGENMPKILFSDNAADVPEEGLFLDGEVIDARLVPIWDDFSEEYAYVPHLSMRDVHDVDSDRVIAGAHDEVWVPLTENGDLLVLY